MTTITSWCVIRMRRTIIFLMLALLLIGSVLAIAFTPKGDVNLQRYYKIINATGISLVNGNITGVNCVIYQSGGMDCSG